MTTNFLEVATTLKYLGAKWLPEKKVNFTPCCDQCFIKILMNTREIEIPIANCRNMRGLGRVSYIAGHKIAPNTGANATKFFTLATKSWKLVARISNHTLPRDLSDCWRFVKINLQQSSSLSPFLKCGTCTISNVNLSLSLDAILDLGNLSGCIWLIVVSSLYNVARANILTDYQLFGIGYHFKIFRSQGATGKKVNFTSCID